MADFLFDLWLNEVPRVHALVRHYLNSSISSIQLRLIQIHKRAIEHCLHELKTSHDEKQKDLLVDLILALEMYNCNSNEFRSSIRDTVKKLVLYASEASRANGQSFTLKLLYRSVLINPMLANFVSELEAECRRDLLQSEPVIIHFQRKNSLAKENFFWKEVYLYLIENKRDLISCALVS